MSKDRTPKLNPTARRTISALLLAVLFSTGLAPLATALLRQYSPPCACCRNGACRCCKRSPETGGGPKIWSRSVCPSNCGCAGVLNTARIVGSIPRAAPAQAVAIYTAQLPLPCAPRRCDRKPEPLRERPPPVLVARSLF